MKKFMIVAVLFGMLSMSAVAADGNDIKVISHDRDVAFKVSDLTYKVSSSIWSDVLVHDGRFIYPKHRYVVVIVSVRNDTDKVVHLSSLTIATQMGTYAIFGSVEPATTVRLRTTDIDMDVWTSGDALAPHKKITRVAVFDVPVGYRYTMACGPSVERLDDVHKELHVIYGIIQ